MATPQSTMELLLDVLADSRQRLNALVCATFGALPPPKAPKPLSPRDNAAPPTLRRKSAKA